MTEKNLKCPACGFERKPEDTACLLCGVEFKYFEKEAGHGQDTVSQKEELKEEKEQKTDLSAEPETPPPAPGENEAPLSGPEETEPPEEELLSLEAEEKSPLTCPKCGFKRSETDTDCPRCNTVYSKYDSKPSPDAENDQESENAVQTNHLEPENVEELKKEWEKKFAEKKPAPPPKEKEDKMPPKRPKLPPAFFYATVAVFILIAVLFAGGKYGADFYRQYKENKARIALENRQKEIARKFVEKKKFIQANIRTLADNKQFELARQTLETYNVPPLENDEVRISLTRYIEEKELVHAVRRIPAREYEKNYKIYLRLSQLDPKNTNYSRKSDYYRGKLADRHFRQAESYFDKKSGTMDQWEEANGHIEKALSLEPDNWDYKNLKYRLGSSRLLFFKGNDNVKMALRDDGFMKKKITKTRRIHVWLKNTGTEPFYINIDFFKLLCRDGKQYTYNNYSKSLVRQLKPGRQTEGNLYFRTSSEPEKLVFNHSTAGKIERVFP